MSSHILDTLQRLTPDLLVADPMFEDAPIAVQSK